MVASAQSRQELQHELILEVRNFEGHGMELRVHRMQEVLDVVPPVDAMAERAVAGPSDDTDHEIGDIVCGIRLFGRCGVDYHVQDPAHVMTSP